MPYYGYDNRVEFSKLVGKTIVSIDGLEVGSDDVKFITEDGCEFHLYHSQDCCESVSIEDIVGDANDLLNTPVVFAEESVSDTNPEGIKKEYQDSFTWTFYRIGTNKGTVVIRWYGESNGYYSESVDFAQTAPDPSDDTEPTSIN